MNTGLAAASVANTAFAFITFVPKPDELITSEPTPNLRVNETAAAVVALGVGLALSFAASDPAPFLFALLTSVAFVLAIEYLARATISAIEAPVPYAPDRMV